MNLPATCPRPLRLSIPPHIPTLLIIIPPRVQLSHSCSIRPPPSLRYKSLATPRSSTSTRSTSRPTPRTVRLGRIHQLKFLRLLRIHLVLKFQIFVRVLVVPISAGACVAEVSGRGITGAREALGGEVGAPAETIGTAEGRVRINASSSC